MAPPPRPPIICYDLQTNTNSRLAPCARYPLATGAAIRSKVTRVQRDSDELSGAKVSACWYHRDFDKSNVTKFEDDSENHAPLNRSRARISNESKFNLTSHQQRPPYKKPYLINPESYQFKSNSLGECQPPVTKLLDGHKTRHAYGLKLKRENEEKERRQEQRKLQLAILERLEEASAELDSAKRIYKNLDRTLGMGHNTAKYIQQQDEELAKLRRKYDEVSETRSRELGRRVQEMKRFEQLQKINDRKLEEERLRDLSRFKHYEHTLSSTLNNSRSSSSPTNNTATPTNTTSSSSTISISSCSSPTSSEGISRGVCFAESQGHNRQPVSNHQTRANLRETSNLLPPSSSTPLSSKRNKPLNGCSALKMSSVKPPDKFSFYKPDPLEAGEILEITDMDFFDKVEDKTMMEVNELFNKMQSVLKDFDQALL